MLAGSTSDLLSIGQDGSRARTLFERIEHVLADARENELYAVEALRRVRALMHTEFSELTIVGKFEINDWEYFRDWSVKVEYPDGRIAKITHES